MNTNLSTPQIRSTAKYYNTVERQAQLVSEITKLTDQAFTALTYAKIQARILYHAVDDTTQYEAMEKAEHIVDELNTLERSAEDVLGLIDDIDLTPEVDTAENFFERSPIRRCNVCGGEGEHDWEVHVAEMKASE